MPPAPASSSVVPLVAMCAGMNTGVEVSGMGIVIPRGSLLCARADSADGWVRVKLRRAETTTEVFFSKIERAVGSVTAGCTVT